MATIIQIDVEDVFRTGYCPVSGKIGVVHKSAYKGYSLSLSAGLLNKLHPLAIKNNYTYAMSVLWGNDPNPRRIAFTSIEMPTIADYTANITDMDGIEFNPAEDYGQNPKFEIWVDNGDGTYSKQQTEPFITRDVNGNIVSVVFSGTGDTINGYIIISR